MRDAATPGLRADQLLHAACLGAAFLVPVVFWHSAQSSFELPKQLALRVVLWVGLAAAGALALSRPLNVRFALPGAGSRWPLWLALVATGVSWTLATLLSTAPQLSWWGHPSRAAGLWTQVGYALLFLCGIGGLRTLERRHRLCVAAAVAGGIASGYALLQRVGLDWLDWGVVSAAGQDVSSLALRPSGTFGNPNFLSGVLAPVLFLTGSAAIATTSRRNRLLLVALGALQALALVSAQTRGAWVGVAAGLCSVGVLVVAARGGPWRRALAGGVIVALLLAAGLRAAAPQLPRDGALGRAASIVRAEDGATAQRLILWRITLDLWRERPLLGYGPETFEAFSQRRLTPELVSLGGGTTSWARAENGLLDALFSVGLLGTLPLLALIGLVLVAGVRRATRQAAAGRADWLAVGLTGGFVTHLATQQFGILEVGAGTIATLTGAALLASAREEVGNVGSTPDAALTGRRVVQTFALPGPVRGVLAAALLPALLGMLWWESRAFRANLAYSAGLAASRAGYVDLEQSHLEEATRSWPHNYRYWVSLAEARREAARALPDGAAAVAARTRLFTGAVDAMARARAISPPDPVLLGIWADTASEAALALNDAGLASRAGQAHTEATALAPNAWELWQSAGLHLYRQMRYAEARTAFERATRIHDRSPIAWALLGDTAGLAEDRTAARAAYRRSLELDPRNEAVQRALTSLGPG